MGFEPDEDADERDHGREGDVKLFIADGDTAVGFETGEELFDAMALTIQILVKVGLKWPPPVG